MEAKGVIHLEIKATGLHRYFGSPSAMYDNYTSQELGIARQSLLNYWQKTEEPYGNAICIIRKGELERKNKKIMKNKEDLATEINKKKIEFENEYNLNSEQVDSFIKQYTKDQGYDNIPNMPIEKFMQMTLDALDFVNKMENKETGSGKIFLTEILNAIS